MTGCFLWVIYRLRFIENAYVFMASQRHTVGIQKSCRVRLFPDEIVPPHLSVTLHQVSGEHPVTEENNCPVIFYDTVIFFPKSVEWNHTVPFIMCLAIREVTDDQVDGMIRNKFHGLKAVGVEKNRGRKKEKPFCQPVNKINRIIGITHKQQCAHQPDPVYPEVWQNIQNHYIFRGKYYIRIRMHSHMQ